MCFLSSRSRKLQWSPGYLGGLDSGEALFLIADIAFLLCPHEVNGGTDTQTERATVLFHKNFKPIIGFPALMTSSRLIISQRPNLQISRQGLNMDV